MFQYKLTCAIDLHTVSVNICVHRVYCKIVRHVPQNTILICLTYVHIILHNIYTHMSLANMMLIWFCTCSYMCMHVDAVCVATCSHIVSPSFIVNSINGHWLFVANTYITYSCIRWN